MKPKPATSAGSWAASHLSAPRAGSGRPAGEHLSEGRRAVYGVAVAVQELHGDDPVRFLVAHLDARAVRDAQIEA